MTDSINRKPDAIVERNIKLHNKVWNRYEKRHTEIYNEIEQKRLSSLLKDAAGMIESSRKNRSALDYGCGAGNLTRYLLNLDFEVTAADVTEKFLEMVNSKYAGTGKLKTLKINGADLSACTSNSFDFVGTYSVLHHVPDYLSIIREFVRVLKPGGVLYLDHEANENFWKPSEELRQFRKLTGATGLRKLKKYASKLGSLSSWKTLFIKVANPRYEPEGDIHVWIDDHIEWNKIEDVLVKKRCSILRIDDYLLYRGDYSGDIYNEYFRKCSDTRALLALKM